MLANMCICVMHTVAAYVHMYVATHVAVAVAQVL